MTVEVISSAKEEKNKLKIGNISLVSLDSGESVLVDHHSGMVFILSFGFIQYVCENPCSKEDRIYKLLDELKLKGQIIEIYTNAKMVIEVSNN